jgi:hypothetical protein
VKWATGSWNSVANVLGFFEHVAAQGAELGVESPSLYGLSFSLTLSRKTKPSERSAFPVVSVSPDCDLVDFFLAQRKRRLELGGGEPKMLPVGARDPEESAAEEELADYMTITPGHVKKPSSGVESEVVDAEAEEVEAPQEEPAAAPDDAARWETLKRKAKALGLTDANLEEAVAAVTDGGIFPDLDAGRDVEVEGELQRLARGKK